jgi:hypothetical protein
MTCPEYQNLLPAFHRGELTEGDSLSLRQHLPSCPACSMENEKVLTVERSLQRIRVMQPVLPGGDAMAREIIQHIRSVSSPGESDGRWDWLTGLFALVQRPAARISYALIVCFSLGMFMVQQGETLTRVSGLEESIARKQGVRLDMRYTLDPARAQTIADIGRFSSLPTLEAGALVLDRQTVTRVLALLERQILPGIRPPGPSAEERSVLESTLREIKKSLWIR